MARVAAEKLSRSMKIKLAKAREKALAEQFVSLCPRFGVPAPEREFRFALPEREWRVDFGWEKQCVALESEGGVWTQGRHTRGSGFIEDIDKYNSLASKGWRLFRVVPSQLCDVSTFRMIATALGVTMIEP